MYWYLSSLAGMESLDSIFVPFSQVAVKDARSSDRPNDDIPTVPDGILKRNPPTIISTFSLFASILYSLSKKSDTLPFLDAK